MADVTVIRFNERIKAFTGQMYNLGAALFAAAIVKGYGDGGFSWAFGLWLVGSIAIILGAHAILGLLQEEG